MIKLKALLVVRRIVSWQILCIDKCVCVYVVHLDRVRTVKNQVSKLNFFYFGLLLVLNHCLNHCEIPSALLMLLEKTNFVIHVIDF